MPNLGASLRNVGRQNSSRGRSPLWLPRETDGTLTVGPSNRARARREASEAWTPLLRTQKTADLRKLAPSATDFSRHQPQGRPAASRCSHHADQITRLRQLGSKGAAQATRCSVAATCGDAHCTGGHRHCDNGTYALYPNRAESQQIHHGSHRPCA